jgi:hypothetical protein
MTKEYGPLPGSKDDDPDDKPDLPTEQPAPPIVNPDRPPSATSVGSAPSEIHEVFIGRVQPPVPTEPEGAESLRNAISECPYMAAVTVCILSILGVLGFVLYKMTMFIWDAFITRGVIFGLSAIMIVLFFGVLLWTVIQLMHYANKLPWSADDFAWVKAIIKTIPVTLTLLVVWIIIFGLTIGDDDSIGM